MQVIRDAIHTIAFRKSEFKLLVMMAVLLSLINLITPSWDDFSALNFLWITLCFGVSIIYGIAVVGFQRVTALSSEHMHSLRELLIIGKHFFWRLVGLALACVLPLGLVFGISLGFFGAQTPDPDKINWSNTGFSLVFQIVLGVVLSVISATLITKDCGVFQSISEARKLKIRATGIIPAIIIVAFTNSISGSFPMSMQNYAWFKLTFLIPNILTQIAYIIVEVAIILIAIQQLGTGSKTQESSPIAQ